MRSSLQALINHTESLLLSNALQQQHELHGIVCHDSSCQECFCRPVNSVLLVEHYNNEEDDEISDVNLDHID